MEMTPEKLQQILEAAILVAGHPLPIAQMQTLFDENNEPDAATLRSALSAIQEKYQQSGIELRELASGFQFQARTELSPWLVKLWEERPPRYSRAFLETLALIAYRQPVTRAEVEEIRGVSASTHIIKTLQDREWIRIVGYREVPGKPALYGTTKVFLDYFNLKSLNELPTLAELNDLDSQEAKLHVQLELSPVDDGDKPIETDAHEPKTEPEEALEETTVTNE